MSVATSRQEVLVVYRKENQTEQAIESKAVNRIPPFSALVPVSMFSA